MNNNMIKFSTEAQETLIPAWKDYVKHYRTENYSVKCSFDGSKSLEEKDKLICSAVDKEVGKLINMDCSFVNKEAFATNPQYHWAYFAVVNKLVDVVLPDIIKDDFMGVANITVVGYGDSAEFDVKSGDLFTVTKNGNSRRHVEVQRQYTGKKSIVATNHTITTDVDWYRVAAGKESLAEYAMKVILSMEAELAIDIMSAVKDSYSTLTANFKEASYSESAFKKLATRVSAANGGAKTVVLGTELGLGTILPTTDSLKMGLGETVAKVGYLPIFKGVPLIALKQRIDWDSEDYGFAIDDTYLYFLSPQTQKLVQVVIEGDTLAITDGQFDNANLTQRTSLHKRWGVGLITNSKYGIMKVTV